MDYCGLLKLCKTTAVTSTQHSTVWCGHSHYDTTETEGRLVG